jgi:hypothetical protein
MTNAAISSSASESNPSRRNPEPKTLAQTFTLEGIAKKLPSWCRRLAERPLQPADALRPSPQTRTASPFAQPPHRTKKSGRIQVWMLENYVKNK